MLSFRSFVSAAVVAAGSAVFAGCSGEHITRPQDELPVAARVRTAGSSSSKLDITPGSDTIAVGDSVVFSDASGADKHTAVEWSSGDTTIAIISDSGVVHARAAGSVQIYGVMHLSALSQSKDSATLVVVAPASPTPPPTSTPATPADTSHATAAVTNSVTVTPNGVRLTPGQSTTLTAKALDASGATIAGRTVAWSTSNAAAATVDATGLTRAVAPGTATITATIDGKSATAAVTVAPATVVSVSVSLNSASINAGQTTQALSIAKDASGAAITGRAVTWTTSNAAVATVSTTGLVSAVGAGTATVTATVDGVAGSATLNVAGTTTPSTPAPPGAIALTIVRMDGGSGSALVSNGIPLAPGVMQPGQSGQLQLFVGGVEQRLYVEELAGRHADGSLSAVLVEFTVPSLSVGSPLAGSLVLGRARQTTDLARPNTTTRGTPAAAALPTDPNYLLATKLVGPTVTVAQATAMGSAFSQYESDFVRYADQHWAAEGATWGDDYYDRAQIYYRWWARTGNPEYWRRGTLFAMSYRTGYLEAYNYQSTPHWSQLEGVAEHYLLTGDEASRTAVGRTASSLMPYFSPGSATMANVWEPRIRARALQGALLAWKIRSTDVPAGATSWQSLLEDALTKTLATVNADGSAQEYNPPEWGCPAGVQNNFQVPLQNDILIRVFEEYRADARVPGAVKRSLDYQWATQWHAADAGFAYMSGQCATVPGLEGQSTTYSTPDLDLLYVGSFGFVYRQTGDATYRTRGDALFAAGVAHTYLVGSKQFNEAYTNSARYLGDR